MYVNQMKLTLYNHKNWTRRFDSAYFNLQKLHIKF